MDGSVNDDMIEGVFPKVRGATAYAHFRHPRC
jgi:hypothetical protein